MGNRFKSREHEYLLEQCFGTYTTWGSYVCAQASRECVLARKSYRDLCLNYLKKIIDK
jgi:hypothetical protein